MNFFERQDAARRNSRWLVILFVVAMAIIVLALDLVVVLIVELLALYFGAGFIVIPPWGHALAMAGTVAVILGVSVHKSLEVSRGGGIAVARMMGARQVVPLRATPLEHRLLNVVKEMAIASGTRMPIVYVMDEHKGINSFAAGFDGSFCVIVVTRGALERLNRDEMQAVIAHEFSHIVNGDMALNLRMVGILAGLLFVGAAGEHILKEMGEASGDGRAVVLALIIGGSLYVAGYAGLFFGRIIKAMVAREREFLADAGSAQFTRHPEGLAGALDQVRRNHSFVLHPSAEDVSHLFFAEAIYLDEERVFSTHPPVDERIRRLVPRFKVDDYRNLRPDPLVELERSIDNAGGSRGALEAQPWKLSASEAVALVGTMEDRDLRVATALLNALPASAHAALQTPEGARAIVLALASPKGGDGPFASLARDLPRTWHLHVLDLALSELREKPEAFRREVIQALEGVIHADEGVSAYRFAYLTFVRTQLERSPPAMKGTKPLSASRPDVEMILSLVAHAGCGNPGTLAEDARKAFDLGAREMGLGGLTPVARDACDPRSVTASMTRLRDLAPLEKARLMRGLFEAISADGLIRVVEAALMRMIGAVLDCPLPSLLDELDPEAMED